MEYKMSNRLRNASILMMIIGLVALVYSFVTDHAPQGVNHENWHHMRFWANLLFNGFYFTGIGLGALFFLAVQYAAEVGWSVVVKRVVEAVSQFLPYGAAVLVIVFLAATFHANHIYHWLDHSLIDPSSDKYDPIIAGKTAYLNPFFFWFRTLLYLGVWIYFMKWFRRASLEEDLVGGTEIYFKSRKMAAIFLVFFAVTSSTSAWDWLMSIDTHWFSTMYGWLTFAGIWVSAMIMIIITTLYLKDRGYLKEVNENHLHDLSKWMFAVSLLWCYLWFSQFMLIWYSNIPEEVVYYIPRLHEFKGFFLGTFFINFAFPFFILMSRDAKRQPLWTLPVAIVLFFSYWLNMYVFVYPGTVGEPLFGFGEIGVMIGFLGLFLFVVHKSLEKAKLIPVNHPFLEESKHIHI
jgi:hypothetical protein